MLKKFLLLVLAIFLLIFCVAGVLVLRFGRNGAIRRVYFLYTGTSDPIALVDQKTAPATHIAYGPDPLEFGELSLPSSGTNFPVAIVIHGGCWSSKLGRTPPELTAIDLLRPLSAALAQQGIAVWNLEYRRLGNPGGGWPGTYQDIGHAADSLPNIAAANHLDLGHVIVIGHSAGGQLALWLAARKKLPSSSEIYQPSPLAISGVVDIDGPPSMEAASTIDDRVCNTHVIQKLLGGTAQQVPERYKQGAADGLLPLGVRQELLYSGKTEFLSEDRSVWSGLFTSYADQATKAGDTVHVTRMDQAGHFDGINPQSKTWPMVLAKIKALL